MEQNRNALGIEIENAAHVYKSFQRGETVLDILKEFVNRKSIDVQSMSDVTFSVAPGEIMGLLGPNGAGKTTLLPALPPLLLTVAVKRASDAHSISGCAAISTTPAQSEHDSNLKEA